MSHKEADQEASMPWSHVSETINMLYLAVCQIETTMTDASTSVDTLTKNFTRLAGHTNEVQDKIQQLLETDELNNYKKDFADTANELQQNISESIGAFQFYDRVCQRIDHVARSLEKVTDILANENQMQNRDVWKGIQEQIKSSYTMEAERIMFEFIMRGGNVKEALEIYKHHFSKQPDSSSDSDEIELF